jgi:hypothetical protein
MNSSIHIWQVTNLNSMANLLKMDSGHFIRVSEYTPTTLILEIENAYAGRGQLVSLSGEILIKNEKFKFEAVSEIIQLQVVEGSLVRFELKLVEVDPPLWEKFLDSKQTAQNHIDRLLQKMKGDS